MYIILYVSQYQFSSLAGTAVSTTPTIPTPHVPEATVIVAHPPVAAYTSLRTAAPGSVNDRRNASAIRYRGSSNTMTVRTPSSRRPTGQGGQILSDLSAASAGMIKFQIGLFPRTVSSPFINF